MMNVIRITFREDFLTLSMTFCFFCEFSKLPDFDHYIVSGWSALHHWFFGVYILLLQVRERWVSLNIRDVFDLLYVTWPFITLLSRTLHFVVLNTMGR